MSDETDGTADLTRRRVLGGLATIGTASAAAGAGTMALFQDSETSGNNTFAAGTLDLEVGPGFSTTVLQISPVKPGESGTARGASINNAGTIDGTLDVVLDTVESRENSVTEPEGESEAEESGGELDENLRLSVYLQFENGTSEPRKEYVIGTAENRKLVSDLTAGLLREGISLNAGEYARVYADYEVLDAGNEIQSDQVELQLAFALNQGTNR
ncbi:TasA family protein [Halorussus sp. AFM4]|uniref:TasA family protein n=1 Tax=Halorussus sp. AFM4 TaxID=3421651 RepID=UPI003EBA6F0B